MIDLPSLCIYLLRQDTDSGWIVPQLPALVERFTFYSDSGATPGDQSKSVQPPQPNAKFLCGMSTSILTHLQHLALSFIVSAEDLLTFVNLQDWRNLTTIALTSPYMTSQSSYHVNNLLKSIARSALHLPRIRLVEIWDWEPGKTGIFRYEKLARCSTIV